jgi:uncharacterized membrane protein YhaH (DUF805 family)
MHEPTTLISLLPAPVAVALTVATPLVVAVVTLTVRVRRWRALSHHHAMELMALIAAVSLWADDEVDQVFASANAIRVSAEAHDVLEQARRKMAGGAR